MALLDAVGVEAAWKSVQCVHSSAESANDVLAPSNFEVDPAPTFPSDEAGCWVTETADALFVDRLSLRAVQADME